ncbi:MAG: ribonuclease III [Chlamydiae bacterium]|jgi:ribonuclease-3|nr:ribonuclease III [Chlamydiota bacterium]
MNLIDQLLLQCTEIESHLGYVFKDKSLLVLAFTHRSFYNEHRDLSIEHNERLEFLGDSVLGLFVSDFLYRNFPGEPEGQLSHFRSQIIGTSTCASYVQKIGVAKYILLGKGERLNDGRGRESILADLFEALIGAIYMDSSFEVAKEFFKAHFEKEMEKALEEPLKNWKAQLQDFSQKKYQKPPIYKVVKETGPEHSKIFYVTAMIGDEEVGQGIGNSKKQAEQAAAENACKYFQLE